MTLAKDVTLNDVSELILGASNITGALTVTAGGDLSQSGALAVDGVLTLNATGFNVDLSTEVDNDFQTLVVSGVDVLLQSSNSIVLADVTATGELNVQSAGSITDSGTVSVDGATTLVAGTDITLDSAASAYDGVLSLQGEDFPGNP